MYPYNNQLFLQNLQNKKDEIDRMMNQLQQSMQPQVQPITQNFQIAPQQSDLESKIVTNVDDVKNTFVARMGIFANKDFSTIWVKDNFGKIRTYETKEVIELDEKDKKIQEQDYEILALKKQVNELKGAILNGNDTSISETTTNKKSSGVQKNKSNDSE